MTHSNKDSPGSPVEKLRAVLGRYRAKSVADARDMAEVYGYLDDLLRVVEAAQAKMDALAGTMAASSPTGIALADALRKLTGGAR